MELGRESDATRDPARASHYCAAVRNYCCLDGACAKPVEDKTNKFKSAEALRTIFAAASVKERDTVATYCHIGQQASLLYFIARYLNYDAHLYDGSFQEWSNRSELPVEKTEPPAPVKP